MDLTLDNCFFNAVNLTENPGLHKYAYSDYGNGFNARLVFSLLND